MAYPHSGKNASVLGLPGGDLGEFGATVADLHGEQTGEPVEIALAAVVEDGDAFAAGDDRRRDVRAVPGEMQPEVVGHVAASVALGSMARLLTRAVDVRRRRRYARAMTSAQQVTEFEALRPHLMSVAYRLTGTVADAEDIVQEAWLRWNRA